MPSSCKLCSLVAAAFTLGACGSNSTGSAEIVHVTAVNVSPVEFLGDVPCRLGDGSAQLYLTTVYDLSARGPGFERGFALPSSQLVPCTQSAGFTRVVVGHWYAAFVQVFDRLSIEPLGPGSPLVVDSASGAHVEPRWTTNCGFPDAAIEEPTTDDYLAAGAAIAASRYNAVVRGCTPLADSTPGSASGVLVPLERLRGSLECGSAADQIEHFAVTLGNETRSVQCGQDVTFDDVEPDRSYTIDVLALAAGASEPSFGARCAAATRTSIVTEADCDPLSDRGSIQIDVPGLLRSAGETCGVSVSRVAVTLSGNSLERTLPVDPTACEQPVRFDDIGAGGYTIRVATELSDGEAGPAFDCAVEAILGDVVSAPCTPS